MKKIILFAILLQALLFLAACSEDIDETDDIVITYAGWNLGDVEANNLERRLIKAFEEANPGVRVDIIERPKIPNADNPEDVVDMNWDEMLASLAATGKLPDVYMYATVPTAVLNGWAEDMTAFMKDDPELLNISQDIATAAVYGDKYFGIPQSNFYFGYFVNNTIFDNGNEARPTFGLTFDRLLTLSKNVSTFNEDGTSILGFQGVDRFFEWLPSQYDASLGWYTFNGQSFNLNSNAFSQAMAFQRQFYSETASTLYPYVWESSKVSDKVAWYSEGTGTQWTKGRHAVRWGGTFDWGWMIPEIANEENGIYGHDIDFIGTPVIVDGVQRIPVVLDYLLVGQGTKQPQLAYELSKWMGFGKEGYLNRLEIAKAFPESGSVNFAPLQQDDELYDAYFSLFPEGSLTEFKKVLAHDSFIIEGLKTIPGYVQARWTGTYGTIDGTSYTITTLLDAIRDGSVLLSDVNVALNDRVNLMYQQAKRELLDRIK
jgi:ABC-type glycerol-3-phosphate transport system substrate-binding protein